MNFPPEVEKWRPLVKKYFAAKDVDKALWVIMHESGGNAGVWNREGESSGGLFQLNQQGGLGQGYSDKQIMDPETNIKIAANAVYGGSGWSPWNEARQLRTDGKMWGALGNHPFPGSNSSSTNARAATSVYDIDSELSSESGLNNWQDDYRLVSNVVNSGIKDPSIQAVALSVAQRQYVEAVGNNDQQAIQYWEQALTALNEALAIPPEEQDPFAYAQTLTDIYGTAVQLGTMKANTASKALEAALEQAALTKDATHLPGLGPGGVGTQLLSSPWAPWNPDDSKYQKVDVPSWDTILTAGETGYQDALNALLGAMPGQGGGGDGAPAPPNTGTGTLPEAPGAAPQRSLPELDQSFVNSVFGGNENPYISPGMSTRPNYTLPTHWSVPAQDPASTKWMKKGGDVLPPTAGVPGGYAMPPTPQWSPPSQGPADPFQSNGLITNIINQMLYGNQR